MSNATWTMRFEWSRLNILENVSHLKLQTSSWLADSLFKFRCTRFFLYVPLSLTRIFQTSLTRANGKKTSQRQPPVWIYRVLLLTFIPWSERLAHNFHGALLNRPSINGNVLVSSSSSPHERVKYDRLKVSAVSEEWLGGFCTSAEF